MITAAIPGRIPRTTRTTGDAHLYRVIHHYDSWPFGHDSRIPRGTDSHRRTETFRTLEPVRQRLARADRHARHMRETGGDWSAYAALAEKLTDHGWQPLDHATFPAPGTPHRTPPRRQTPPPALNP